MPLILAIAIAAIAIVLGIVMLKTVVNVLWMLLVGLVIGAVARLVLPGRQNIGWLSTALFGVAGSFLGGILALRVLGWGELGQLLLGIVVAAALIAAFAGTLGHEGRRARI